MAGVSLLAAVGISAIAAMPALAKDPYTDVNSWAAYKYCPYENPEIDDCFAGITAGGSKGGFFQFGNVKVKLNKTIVLQGGFIGAGSTIKVVPAAHGGETLESPELKLPGGLSLITKSIQAEKEWPDALKQSFKEAKHNKENGANVKIELAGTELFTVPGSLDIENIINESGVAFRLPLKVRIISPWLEKLGGGPCTIGSDEHPVLQHLTTEGAGRATTGIEFNEAFTNIFIRNSQLVDTGWHIEEASKATGCGGEYEPFVNAALNRVLESDIPSRVGITVLTGNLHDGSAFEVRDAAEKGEL
jgi:hypothetical protein